MNENSPTRVTRRSVTAGLAWSVPTVLTVTGAPLAAASPSTLCDPAGTWTDWLNTRAGLVDGESLQLIMADQPVYDENGNQTGTELRPTWEFTGTTSFTISYRDGSTNGRYWDPSWGVTTQQVPAAFRDQELAQVSAITFGGRDRRYEISADGCTVAAAGACDPEKAWRENPFVQVDLATGQVTWVVTRAEIERFVAARGGIFTEIVSITGYLNAWYPDGDSAQAGPVSLTLDERGAAVVTATGPVGVLPNQVSMALDFVLTPADPDSEVQQFYENFQVLLNPDSCQVVRGPGAS